MYIGSSGKDIHIKSLITTKESDINTIQSLSYAQFPGNKTLCLASTVYTDILKTLTRVVWYLVITSLISSTSPFNTLVKTVAAAEDGSPRRPRIIG